MLLRFFQQRPFAEVGAALNLTEDAARMRVERALDKLHALLGRRGITSTRAALATVFANQAMVAAPTDLAASITGAALTSAAASGASAVAAPALFMSKTTLTIAAVALAMAFVAFREFHQRRDVEAVSVATQAELVGLRAQLRESGPRVATAEKQSAVLRREVDALRAEPGVPSAKGGGIMGFVPSDPRAPTQPSTPTLLAEAMNSVSGPLYRQLGLTSEQREQFAAIIIEFKERGNELFGAAIAAGIKPSAGLAQQISAQTAPERAARLGEAFGEATLQAFQQFEALAPLRSTTSQLASALFQSEAPLSPVQADQLVTIMATNMPATDGKFDVVAMNTEAIMAQAQGVLSPAQVLPFQRLLESARENAQIRREQQK